MPNLRQSTRQSTKAALNALSRTLSRKRQPKPKPGSLIDWKVPHLTPVAIDARTTARPRGVKDTLFTKDDVEYERGSHCLIMTRAPKTSSPGRGIPMAAQLTVARLNGIRFSGDSEANTHAQAVSLVFYR